MLKVTVNEDTPFEVKQEKDSWYINGSHFEGNVVQVSDDHYHVIWNDRSFEVELVEKDSVEKKAVLKINGQLLTTTARDRVSLLLESMGMGQAATAKINDIKAPMPGLIQSVTVTVGDTVKKGDILLVLVAMKMENAIKAPTDATVQAIRIEPGTSVEKNQVLIEFA
jgi:biotin carboxyl carrier protein